MFLQELRQPVESLRNVGPALASKLGRLGIGTIGELLTHYPRDYEDRSAFLPLSRFTDKNPVHTVAEVTAHEWFGYGAMRTLKIRVRDESSEAVLICFNRPFLEKSLPVGARILLHGKFQFRYGEIQSTAFDAELYHEGSDPLPGLLPLYALTGGLSQAALRKLLKRALEMYGRRVENELSSELIAHKGLMPKAEALRAIHFPKSEAEKSLARTSLAYEELFHFQLGIALRIQARKLQNVERKPVQGILGKRLLERLPFSLTQDQVTVLQEIQSDMDRPQPMARLLQGDVGSGKTIVALLAALHTVERGAQVAMMAPTELLARQHAATAAKLLEPLGVRLAFLTGNVDDASRPPLLKALASGEVDIVLGTHALFSADVLYKDLRLVIIDEQHRFGVVQRMALYKKGYIPDLLMMTATPIPRSLALTLFGDLAVSSINSLPPGRKPVITHLAKEGNESKVYKFVHSMVAQGRQAFFVYPLIEESEKSELKNVQDMASFLARKVYPQYSLGFLHSRLKEEEKRSVMDAFVAGEIQILVATSLIEVGVDIPNAAVMVIEHAERFGLSALHQLRGRIGRSGHQSYCFLVYSKEIGEEAVQRLKALYSSTDGFALAEEDLRIRGPGELLGTAQSGALRLLIADPLKDFELLKSARLEAFAVVKEDPSLLFPAHEVYRRIIDTRSAAKEA
ncbi:MAG: ATP-dependent DNA helicase RecG [Spirochaetales bacterium]|nr:ATP-dependent DNA helicase RecG [Spirochaetales bacterium]